MGDDDYESPITKAWAGKYLEQDKEITSKQAMECLAKTLREDKFYRGKWQEGIAIAFRDEVKLWQRAGRTMENELTLTDLALSAADRFLKRIEVIGKPDSENGGVRSFLSGKRIAKTD